MSDLGEKEESIFWASNDQKMEVVVFTVLVFLYSLLIFLVFFCILVYAISIMHTSEDSDEGSTRQEVEAPSAVRRRGFTSSATKPRVLREPR